MLDISYISFVFLARTSTGTQPLLANICASKQLHVEQAMVLLAFQLFDLFLCLHLLGSQLIAARETIIVHSQRTEVHFAMGFFTQSRILHTHTLDSIYDFQNRDYCIACQTTASLLLWDPISCEDRRSKQ